MPVDVGLPSRQSLPQHMCALLAAAPAGAGKRVDGHAVLGLIAHLKIPDVHPRQLLHNPHSPSSAHVSGGGCSSLARLNSGLPARARSRQQRQSCARLVAQRGPASLRVLLACKSLQLARTRVHPLQQHLHFVRLACDVSRTCRSARPWHKHSSPGMQPLTPAGSAPNEDLCGRRVPHKCTLIAAPFQ